MTDEDLEAIKLRLDSQAWPGRNHILFCDVASLILEVERLRKLLKMNEPPHDG